jgi:hypothetical protein
MSAPKGFYKVTPIDFDDSEGLVSAIIHSKRSLPCYRQGDGDSTVLKLVPCEPGIVLSAYSVFYANQQKIIVLHPSIPAPPGFERHWPKNIDRNVPSL